MSNKAADQLTVDILRTRLLNREGGGGQSALARGTLSSCASRYRDFVQKVLSASTTSSTEEILDAQQSLKRELLLHSLEMKKLQLVAKSTKSELSDYDVAQVRIENSILKNKEEIDSLKQQLIQEGRIRRDKEEYEALAKIANLHASKRETEMKLADVTREIEIIKKREMETVSELEMREKQFQLLLKSIFDLKSSITEDIINEKNSKSHSERNGEGGKEINNKLMNIDDDDIDKIDTAL
mmetsp:Transcript_9001/g.10404  ORF Transcript_9001/g.10404 Transcript_9001/m.10404 type:complete len:240 (-) Transcript_9001:57-776(-)|eukprot:CAMPEP_0194390690 /NCGR_PEP_ID=MMETSP0174-20130528/111542_1 /TAXON_ID=216777 /ORGANISM="Proboscia alata, Strain PI-D3" /LENGTH=239 /DNA_ID=CAMNT_0039184319 /DNA_START=85 /DNA_END=804 /DNA_ORIENTATION=+